MSTHNPIKEYFEKCLSCIFSQSIQDFELILVDDGSDEPVINYISGEKYDKSKIKYIRLDNNVGLPKALNIGIEKCSGEYIARMDDDDLMTVDRLEKQLNYVKNNGFDGCFCWYDNIDKNDVVLNSFNISLPEKKFLNQLVKKGNIFCHASLFISTKAMRSINGYDENLRYAQDSDLYIRLLEKYNIGMVKERLVQHRINDYRNNKYRETLSLTYALFGSMRYYTNNKKSSKFAIAKRLLHYYIGILRIRK